MFGGVGGSTLAGSTVVEKNLDRLTVVVALVFVFTTVFLSMRLDWPRPERSHSAAEA